MSWDTITVMAAATSGNSPAFAILGAFAFIGLGAFSVVAVLAAARASGHAARPDRHVVQDDDVERVKSEKEASRSSSAVDPYVAAVAAEQKGDREAAESLYMDVLGIGFDDRAADGVARLGPWRATKQVRETVIVNRKSALQAVLRRYPGRNSPQVASLPLGTRVQTKCCVVSSQGTWCAIDAGEGRRGWISLALLEFYKGQF